MTAPYNKYNEWLHANVKGLYLDFIEQRQKEYNVSIDPKNDPLKFYNEHILFRRYCNAQFEAIK